ncbi:hypothetical protein OFB51_24955, partial [Escherichia coli]|nr:hypothetical protein [Escherichia coli]
LLRLLLINRILRRLGRLGSLVGRDNRDVGDMGLLLWLIMLDMAGNNWFLLLVILHSNSFSVVNISGFVGRLMSWSWLG